MDGKDDMKLYVVIQMGYAGHGDSQETTLVGVYKTREEADTICNIGYCWEVFETELAN